MKYDIFISYRRDGGDLTAIAIRDRLAARGYRVFMDVEALRAGPFNQALYQVMESCKDVLVLLSPDSLDRCKNQDDWVRLEISHAFAKGKNIIPVMTRGFRFPETLSPDIESLRSLNGLTASVEFFDAFIINLTKSLKSAPVKKYHFFACMCGVLLTIALAAGAIWGAVRQPEHQTEQSLSFPTETISVYPTNQAEEQVVTEVLSYIDNNLSFVNDAAESYSESLDAFKYLLQDGSQNRESVSRQIHKTYKSIEATQRNLQQGSPALSHRLDHTPFNKEELMAMSGSIEKLLQEMQDNLKLLEQNYLSPLHISPEEQRTGMDILNVYIQMEELLPEYLFYSVNKVLLPVTNKDSLRAFKTDTLPRMMTVYTGQRWIGDRDELDGLLEWNFCKKNQLADKLEILCSEDAKRMQEMNNRLKYEEMMTEQNLEEHRFSEFVD